jgi:multiple sugar transport system permease protein
VVGLASILKSIGRIREQGLTRKQFGYLIVIPALVTIACISVYPFIMTTWYSLHTMKLNVPSLGTPFIGLKNYVVLLKTPRFINSFGTSFIFSTAVVASQLLFGMGVALVIHKRFMGRGLVRATVLVPWAMALVITAILWQWMYNAVFGIINALFLGLGIISQPRDWLGTTTSALLSVLVAEIWRNTPFMAIVLLAGLQTIPEEIYEAAKIDGAGPYQSFMQITLPLLKPAILVALLFRSIDAFRAFDLMYVLTQGGPGTSTEIASLYSYKILFQYLDFGKGSAAAIIMAVVTTALCLIYTRVITIEEH